MCFRLTTAPVGVSANEGGSPAAAAAPAANEGQAEDGKGERLNASSSALASATPNSCGLVS